MFWLGLGLVEALGFHIGTEGDEIFFRYYSCSRKFSLPDIKMKYFSVYKVKVTLCVGIDARAMQYLFIGFVFGLGLGLVEALGYPHQDRR